jgi:hypothetical protein
MTPNTILKKMLGVKNAVIDSLDYSENDKGVGTITVNVHLYKREECRCPYCNKKKSPYDDCITIEEKRKFLLFVTREP